MKRVFLSLSILLASVVWSHAQPAAPAQPASPDQARPATPDIPGSAWEQHPEGVALNVSLGASAVKNATGRTITVQIKNTTNANIYYLGWDEPVFIVTPTGEVALRDNLFHGSRIRPPAIKPGETVVRTVDLSPEEMARIKGKPVECHLRFYNISDSNIPKYTEIHSLPKIIVP